MVWFGVATTLLGLLATTFGILISGELSRRDGVRDDEREKLLKIAQDDARQARSLAARAEVASRPKSFKERLESLLTSIDPALVPHLNSVGDVHVTGYMKPWQFAELQKLAAEPEGQKYISFKVGPKGLKASTEGMLTDVDITVILGF